MQVCNPKSMHDKAFGKQDAIKINMQEEMLMNINVQKLDTQHTRINHMHEL